MSLAITLVVRGSDPPSGRHCVPIHVDPDTPRVGVQYTLADCGPIQLDWYVSTKNKNPQFYHFPLVLFSNISVPISISLAITTLGLALLALAFVLSIT